MRHSQDRDPAPPAAQPPMDAAELEDIGERLFGRVGWTVKIAKLLGKDASTLRRWRAGSPIEPAYAAIIRAYAAKHLVPASRAWDAATAAPGAGALLALRLVARAQAMAGAGAPVGMQVTEDGEGLALTLRIGGRQPLTARMDADGFHGLPRIEKALAGLAGCQPPAREAPGGRLPARPEPVRAGRGAAVASATEAQ